MTDTQNQIDIKIKALKKTYEAERQKLFLRAFDEPRPAWKALSDLTDKLLIDLAQSLGIKDICILAIGGYGRGELAPWSDIDLALQLKSKLGTPNDSAYKFIHALWDMGLKASPIIGTTAELLHSLTGHHDRLTAFLDHRRLIGPETLYQGLSEGFETCLREDSVPFFIAAKLKERDENHSRFGNSRYCVEPNIKFGKGGLRDIHALYWILKRLGRVENQDALFISGLLTPEEQQSLKAAYTFLWRIRWNLHLLHGRGEERLVFDSQLQLAENLGFEGADRQEKAAAMMRDYFIHTRHIGEATRSLCAFLEAQHYAPHLTQARLPYKLPELPVPFIFKGQRLDVTHDTAFDDDPENAVRLFKLSQMHQISIHPEALRHLTARLPGIRDHLKSYARYLPDMLMGPKPEKTLRQMHDAGVLTAILPEFSHLAGLMQYDGYHQYTADEHIITAVGILSSMFQPEQDLSGIASAPLKMRSLMIAMLFHDIGKGHGGEHEEKGAEILFSCADRLGLTLQEAERAAFLIRHSGLMGSMAFKKDIHDPKTISDFTSIVTSLIDLKMLYLLTLSDSLAVGEHYWNQWKNSTLKNLYLSAYTVLTGQSIQDNLSEQAARDYPDLYEIAPQSYWTAIDADLLRKHAGLIKDYKGLENGRFQTETLPALGVTQVTVYTPDRSGLFRDLCGAMTLADARIVSARIFTFKNRMAIDSFDIQTPNAAPLDHTDYLERSLDLALKNPEEIARQLEPALQHNKDTPRDLDETTIDFDNNASLTATLIEINTPDRRGLLYTLALGLSELKIQIISAKVMTHRHRAVDIFYIKDRSGMKITKPVTLATIARKLHQLLS